MKSYFKVIIAICLLSIVPVFAQFETDAIHLEVTHIPNSDLNNASANADLTEIDFQSFTPTIRIGSTTKLNSIINYRLYDYNFDSSNEVYNAYPDNLHHFKYTLLVRQVINENWTAYIAPRLNIRTDLKKSIHSDDMFPALTALFIKDVIKNPNYKYGIGINVNNNNGSFRVLPALYFQYKKENMKISAFIPSKASIIFSKGNYDYGFGYHAESNITHLNLSKDPLVNPDNVTYLRNQNVFIYPSYSRHLGSNIWLNAKAGITIIRLYEQYNEKYDNISGFYNDTFKPNFFMNIGLSFRVNDSKK